MKNFEYRKLDSLYWQVVSDWLSYHDAEVLSGIVSNELCGKSVDASIVVARHRDDDYPFQHLIDIWFESEADEAEFILKESI